jgi:hypothetical protein
VDPRAPGGGGGTPGPRGGGWDPRAPGGGVEPRPPLQPSCLLQPTWQWCLSLTRPGASPPWLLLPPWIAPPASGRSPPCQQSAAGGPCEPAPISNPPARGNSSSSSSRVSSHQISSNLVKTYSTAPSLLGRWYNEVLPALVRSFMALQQPLVGGAAQ